MTEDYDAHGFGQHDPARRKSSLVQNSLGIGCLGCLGLIIIVTCLFMWAYYHGKSDLRPVAEKFIRLAESGQYEAAYQEIGKDWSEIQSFEQFETYYATCTQVLGNRKSLKFIQVAQNASTSEGRTAVLTFRANYDNGAVTLVVSMKKYGDQWRVFGCRYQSPLFEESLTCSECGTLHGSFVKYCSNCGALMSEEEQQ